MSQSNHPALFGLTQEALRSADALEVALECMPVGISWATVDTQKIVFTNRTFTELFGYSARDFSDIDDWIERAYPNHEDRVLARQTWGEYFLRPDRQEFPVDPLEICVRCRNGETKTVVVSGVILPETGWALATFVDVSERKRNELLLETAERNARGNEALYKIVIDHSPEMLVLSPLNGGERYVSPGVKALTGFNAEEYLAIKGLDFMHPDERPRASAIIEDLRKGKLSHTLQYRALQKSGGYRWVEAVVTGYTQPDGLEVGGYVASLRDLTDQKEREDRLAAENLQLSAAALKDELTGIANRRGFNQILHRESLRQGRSNHDLSLLIFDVDCFKQYNDLYGHLGGDECLKTIAYTVSSCLRRESDLLARFGGEEFVALLPMTDAAGAVALAEKARAAVASLGLPHPSSAHQVVTVSVGVSTWIAGGELDSQSLLAQADAALYRAKEHGRNRSCHAGSLRRPPRDSPQATVSNGERRGSADRVE